MSTTPWLVRLTVAVYRVLLFLYPPSFRRQFGKSMVQLVRDTCLDAYSAQGRRGVVDVWTAVLSDYCFSVAREYRETLRVSRILARGLPVVWAILAVVSLGLWIGSINDSIGQFGLRRDLSLRFTKGMMMFRHIYAYDIDRPIPMQRWYETATRRGWFRPVGPTTPSFAYSSGHVVGISNGGEGIANSLVSPAEYSLLRVPLWLLLVPCLVWTARALWRWAAGHGTTGGGATMTFSQ